MEPRLSNYLSRAHTFKKDEAVQKNSLVFLCLVFIKLYIFLFHNQGLDARSAN